MNCLGSIAQLDAWLDAEGAKEDKFCSVPSLTCIFAPKLET